jgi:hypothetical protein
VNVSCLCPGPSASGFRERAGTGKTRLATAAPVAPSLPVAEQGYRGWRANKRVVVTGARNRMLAELVQVLPRRAVLRMVRQLQSPR